MKDSTYLALQKSKSVIDEIVTKWNEYTDKQKLDFFKKFQSITHTILVKEAKNFNILKNKS